MLGRMGVLSKARLLQKREGDGKDAYKEGDTYFWRNHNPLLNMGGKHGDETTASDKGYQTRAKKKRLSIRGRMGNGEFYFLEKKIGVSEN